MNLEDLEEYLSDFLPTGFRIDTNKKGELIIYTGLIQEEDGELTDLKEPEDESEEESEFPEEFDPLEDEEEVEDE